VKATTIRTIGALVSGIVCAVFTFWLLGPDCYISDGEAGTSMSGCFTRTGLSTEIGPGLFLLALGSAALVFLAVTAIVWRALKPARSLETGPTRTLEDES
jgi:hypothetical protein